MLEIVYYIVASKYDGCGGVQMRLIEYNFAFEILTDAQRIYAKIINDCQY